MNHELTPAELTIANRSRRFLRIGAVTLFTVMPLSWFVGARTTLVYGMLVAPTLAYDSSHDSREVPTMPLDGRLVVPRDGRPLRRSSLPPLRRLAQRDPVNA